MCQVFCIERTKLLGKTDLYHKLESRTIVIRFIVLRSDILYLTYTSTLYYKIIGLKNGMLHKEYYHKALSLKLLHRNSQQNILIQRTPPDFVVYSLSLYKYNTFPRSGLANCDQVRQRLSSSRQQIRFEELRLEHILQKMYNVSYLSSHHSCVTESGKQSERTQICCSTREYSGHSHQGNYDLWEWRLLPLA